MNNKGQIDITTFAFIIIGLLILAPIILKVVKAPLDKFSDTLNQTAFSGSNASAEVSNIENKFVGFFDTIIMVAFLINVILLLISSFLIDVHPAFLVIFIILAIFTLIFAPLLNDSLDKLYSATGGFSDEVNNLPMAKFMYENLGVVLLGIFIVCGVIIYAKFKYGGNN